MEKLISFNCGLSECIKFNGVKHQSVFFIFGITNYIVKSEFKNEHISECFIIGYVPLFHT